MTDRNLHIVHLLIHQNLPGDRVGYLLSPHEHWRGPDGLPYLALPTKTTVADPLASFLQGTSIEAFVDRIARDDLKLDVEAYALERELEAVVETMLSPTHREPTRYTVYPIDLWVHPAHREPLRDRLQGEWLTAEEALARPRLSPTARAVFESGRLPPGPVADRPTMDAWALKWLAHNRGGVRHLTRKTIDEVLDLGDRAFNLRVADPYLRYQMQGVGFTWSFFTHKDAQDCHVHGAPVVEIYGVLEGRLEIWSKPYHDRGTSAWSHRILEAGDWAEVDSLQCHLVRWQGSGKGVVFKAGPGPLAEVGRLGVKGKTPCKDCTCMKPEQVRALEPGR